MKWTSRRPRKVGWYWWRASPRDTEPECVHVYREGGVLAMETVRTADLLKNFNGEWILAPIPEPAL